MGKGGRRRGNGKSKFFQFLFWFDRSLTVAHFLGLQTCFCGRLKVCSVPWHVFNFFVLHIWDVHSLYEIAWSLVVIHASTDIAMFWRESNFPQLPWLSFPHKNNVRVVLTILLPPLISLSWIEDRRLFDSNPCEQTYCCDLLMWDYWTGSQRVKGGIIFPR